MLGGKLRAACAWVAVLLLVACGVPAMASGGNSCLERAAQENGRAWEHARAGDTAAALDSEMNAISWQRCAVSGDPANFATLKRAGEYYMYAAEYAHATGNASEANYLIGKALKIFAQMRSVKSVRGQLLDETLNDVRIAKRESNGEWPRV